MSFVSRLWFTALVITDRLLGTRLVERELARLQKRIGDFQTQANAIRSQMEEVSRLLFVSQVELCILYLHQRRLARPETWLCFVPAESIREEKDLDLLIGQLAKHGLATVRTEATKEQAYIYHLHPDWNAIERLLHAEKRLDPMVLTWLEELRSEENGEICH
jgi:hypothetical protein